MAAINPKWTPLRIAIVVALMTAILLNLVAEHRELLRNHSIVGPQAASTEENASGASVDAHFAVFNASLQPAGGNFDKKAGPQQSRLATQAVNGSFRRAERLLLKVGTVEALRDAAALALYLDRPVPEDVIRKAPSDHDAHFWLALEPGVTLSSDTAVRMEQISAAWKMGWYRNLLLAGAYRHAQSQRGVYWQQRAIRDSRAFVVGGGLTGLTVILFIAAGFILSLVGMIFWKRLYKLPSPLREVPALPCIEAAVLWLFVLMFGGVLTGPLLSQLSRSLRLPAVVVMDLLTGIAGVLFLRWWVSCNGLNIAIPGRRSWKLLVKDAGWGFLGYLCIVPWMMVAAWLSSHTVERLPHTATPVNPAVTLMGHARSGMSLFLLFVMVCVLAPIFEERFFRGAIYPALRRRLPVWVAASLTGAIFAGIHPQVPVGFLPLFVIGSGFCLLYEIRGSTVASVVAHSLNNSLIFLLMIVLARD